MADLGVLFDGDELPEDDTPTPTPEAVTASALQPAGDTPKAEPPKHALEVIHPHQYRLIGDLDHRPGEDAWAYLERITPALLKELVAMATAPPSIINARVKLDALKELIQRPMPARQVYDIRTPAIGSEFDRMSDEQVRAFVQERLGQGQEASAPEPIAEPATPTPEGEDTPT